MSSDSINTDWLDTKSLNSVAARRFAEFCQQDIQTYDDPEDPDNKLYHEAAFLMLKRIEKAVRGEQQ